MNKPDTKSPLQDKNLTFTTWECMQCGRDTEIWMNRHVPLLTSSLLKDTKVLCASCREQKMGMKIGDKIRPTSSALDAMQAISDFSKLIEWEGEGEDRWLKYGIKLCYCPGWEDKHNGYWLAFLTERGRDEVVRMNGVYCSGKSHSMFEAMMELVKTVEEGREKAPLPYKYYKKALEMLTVRENNRGKESKEENDILDEMDVLWEKMTDEECQKCDKQEYTITATAIFRPGKEK